MELIGNFGVISVREKNFDECEKWISKFYPVKFDQVGFDFVNSLRSLLYCNYCYSSFKQENKDKWITFECGHMFHIKCAYKLCQAAPPLLNEVDKDYLFELSKILGICSNVCPIDTCKLHRDPMSRKSLLQMYGFLDPKSNRTYFPKKAHSVIAQYLKPGDIFISVGKGVNLTLFFDGSNYHNISKGILPSEAWYFVKRYGIEKYAQFAKYVLLPRDSEVLFLDENTNKIYGRVNVPDDKLLLLKLFGKENLKLDKYDIDGHVYSGQLKLVGIKA